MKKLIFATIFIVFIISIPASKVFAQTYSGVSYNNPYNSYYRQTTCDYLYPQSTAGVYYNQQNCNQYGNIIPYPYGQHTYTYTDINGRVYYYPSYQAFLESNEGQSVYPNQNYGLYPYTNLNYYPYNQYGDNLNYNAYPYTNYGSTIQNYGTYPYTYQGGTQNYYPNQSYNTYPYSQYQNTNYYGQYPYSY